MSVTLISDYFFKRFFSFPGWNNSVQKYTYTQTFFRYGPSNAFEYAVCLTALFGLDNGQRQSPRKLVKVWGGELKTNHGSHFLNNFTEASASPSTERWVEHQSKTKAFWTNLLSKDTKLEPVCPHQQVKVRHLSLRTQYQLSDMVVVSSCCGAAPFCRGRQSNVTNMKDLVIVLHCKMQPGLRPTALTTERPTSSWKMFRVRFVPGNQTVRRCGQISARVEPAAVCCRGRLCKHLSSCY